MKGFFAIVLVLISYLLVGQNIDSLEKQVNVTYGENKVRILSDLSWYLRANDPEKAWEYGNHALDEAQQLGFKKGEAQAYNDLGILLFDKSEFDSALAYYDTSLVIRKSIKDVEGMASLYNKIGIIHQTRRNIDKSIEYALLAISIYDTLGKQVELSHCWNNLGVVCFNANLFEKSKKYHLRALESRKIIDNDYLLGASYINLANLTSIMKDTLGATLYYDSAMTKLESFPNSEGYSSALNNYASFLITQRKFEKALPIIEEGLELRNQNGTEVDIASSKGLLGLCLAQLGQYSKGYQMLKEAEMTAVKLNLMQHKVEFYEYLSVLFELQNKLDSSLHYYKLSALTEDSVLNENLNEQLSEMTTRFETKKKEFAIKDLSQKNEIIELEFKKKQNQFLGLLLISLAMVAIGILSYFQLKNVQKRKLIQTRLDEQQKGLNAVILAEEEERKRIAKDLHDGIGQELSGIKLFISKINDGLKKENSSLAGEMEKLEDIIDNTCSEVRNISHKMMPRTLMEQGLVEAIADMLQKGLGHTDMKFHFEHFNIKTRFEERVEIALYRISQELISNIIKHSRASEVSVQLYQNKKSLILIIEDNGVGMSKSAKKDGIGQLNMSSRINNLNGSFFYDSEITNGTLVTVKIPLV
ncbi:MAG: tetratricopeptide repeat-containing sensor histidine kinase [Salibacteraceae bacterium]